MLFRTALNNNIIPHIWKLANIVHIPKYNKDIDKGTSYRTISLLSVIADTGEDHSSLLNSKHTNTCTQHRYKTQHCTVTSLHTLKFNQMAPHTLTINVAFNMSNSFDTINIHTLISGTSMKFIANYIKGCKPYTTYRKYLVKTPEVKYMLTVYRINVVNKV